MYVLNQIYTPLLNTVIEKLKPGKFPKMKPVILQYSFWENLFFLSANWNFGKPRFQLPLQGSPDFRAAQSGKDLVYRAEGETIANLNSD